MPPKLISNLVSTDTAGQGVPRAYYVQQSKAHDPPFHRRPADLSLDHMG